MLSFDPTEHVYRWRGQPVPSVTQVMTNAGLTFDYSRVPERYLRRAAARGTAVHRAVAQALRTGSWQLDFGVGWDPDIEPAVRAAERFFTDSPLMVKTQRVEQMMYSQTYGFAGTVDWRGKVEDLPSIIDFKTADRLDVVAAGIQTAAYEILDREVYGGSGCLRFALHLRCDGTYHLEPLADDNDGPAFIEAALEARGVSREFWADPIAIAPEF